MGGAGVVVVVVLLVVLVVMVRIMVMVALALAPVPSNEMRRTGAVPLPHLFGILLVQVHAASIAVSCLSECVS